MRFLHLLHLKVWCHFHLIIPNVFEMNICFLVVDEVDSLLLEPAAFDNFSFKIAKGMSSSLLLSSVAWLVSTTLSVSNESAGGDWEWVWVVSTFNVFLITW